MLEKTTMTKTRKGKYFWIMLSSSLHKEKVIRPYSSKCQLNERERGRCRKRKINRWSWMDRCVTLTDRGMAEIL